MNEEARKVRCLRCELANWSDEATCRRCGEPLPRPLVNIVERIVEKSVLRQDPKCLLLLEQACDLIAAAMEKMKRPEPVAVIPEAIGEALAAERLPTLAEMERTLILTAYERSGRKALKAAQLLGIGKTTLYRKLKKMGEERAAASPGLELAA